MAYKLLLVDDDRDVIETLKVRLSNEGYVVFTAFDGEEALVKVEQDNPDIILLDLVIPKLGGHEVLKVVREKYKDRWRPIIIMSAKNELDSVQESYELEADHYLVKPCTIDNILRGIRVMISLIPLRKDNKQ